MAAATTVSVGRTRSGYCVRIEGRGTLRESPAVHAFADWILADPANDLVLDLSACDYVDSTFMGCMAWLQRRFGTSGAHPGRIAFVTPPPSCRKAIETMHLDSVLNLVPRAGDHWRQHYHSRPRARPRGSQPPHPRMPPPPRRARQRQRGHLRTHRRAA